MKDRQYNDAQNSAIGLNIDGTAARAHKAAPINGSKSGKAEPPTNQGTK